MKLALRQPVVALFLVLFFSISVKSSAQKNIITGHVTNTGDRQPLVGATISAGKGFGAITDENGAYKMELPNGIFNVSFSYIGFLKQVKQINSDSAKNMTIDAALQPDNEELNLVVVSASKYEKKITDETVSMEVLKPNFVLSGNNRSADEALARVPGVNFVDDQVNIRGGSGFSYGAGSRVLVLVDGIPQLTADANDVKWEFLPIEITNQIEVIKGASSVLYGSSALNGVIDFRTAYPTSTPETNITAYGGFYQNPADKRMIWWENKQPYFSGAYFSHKQKYGPLDLVLGGNLYSDESFRQGEYAQRARFNVNTRYRFKNIDGLSAGINTNYLYFRSGTYFLWANDTTGALRPLGGIDTPGTTISEGRNTRWSVDPFITYFTPNGSHHDLKLRYFYTRNFNNTDQGSTARLYYGEYDYQKKFFFDMNLTAGLAGSYSNVNSQLYGNHHGDNEAAFLQLDKEFGKLSLVGGVRYEVFSIDSDRGNSGPVFRAGANYQVAQGTYLRASFGEGYRFPSIAEKYIQTSVGSLNVFPNPDVQPEYGWSSEIGIKQAFKLNQWLGYADLAGFIQRYHNLIEFQFGDYPPGGSTIDLNYLGFKSVNITNARITGAEFSLVGEGSFGNMKTSILGGLTFISPVNIDQQKFVDSLLNSDHSLSEQVKDSLRTSEILYYRSKWLLRFNDEMGYKKWLWGFDVRYISFMTNIDPFFEGTDPLILKIFHQPVEFIPGVKEFREAHQNGDYIIDIHAGYQFTDHLQAQFIIKNLLNRTYSERPAELEAPRNCALQVNVKF